jgi:blocked-early-in-transport protein 1
MVSPTLPNQKGLTLDINKEVREQNTFLDQMEQGFENAGDMLKDSLGRIGIMLDSTSGKHMCYMVMFAVFVVVFLYWMMTYKGKNGA